MRFVVHTASPQDVSEFAASFARRTEQEGIAPGPVVARLERACRHSHRIWIARELSGRAAGLFGVAALPSLHTTGVFWSVLLAGIGEGSVELRQLLQLLVPEMLEDFERIENAIDARKTQTLDLMRGLGFSVGAPKGTDDPQLKLCLVWREAADLRGSGGTS